MEEWFSQCDAASLQRNRDVDYVRPQSPLGEAGAFLQAWEAASWVECLSDVNRLVVSTSGVFQHHGMVWSGSAPRAAFITGVSRKLSTRERAWAMRWRRCLGASKRRPNQREGLPPGVTREKADMENRSF